MTEPTVGRGPVESSEEISILAMASAILRRWRLIVAVTIVGGIAGLLYGLSKPRLYESAAIFVPQGTEQASLGFAASQFGIRIPTASGSWGPSMYVELIRTRDMLEPIIHDTVTVAEQGNRRLPLMELLEVKGVTPERRARNAIGGVSGMIDAAEAKKLNAVKVTVKSPWPSVSYALTLRLVQRVNQFNIETRRSQATVERQFVETQAREAERVLRDAEDRQKAFLQRNRAIDGSPELRAANERLQRDVTRLSQLYLAWMQNLDEARTREVRDTPVITMLEEPRLPIDPAPRGVARRAVVAAIAAGMLAVLFAVLIEGWSVVRKSSNQEVRDFLQALRDATPRFMRRRSA